MDPASIHVPLTLPNGVTVGIEASPRRRSVRPGEQDVGFAAGIEAEADVASIAGRFEDLAKVIEGVAASLTATVERVALKRTQVEFGLEVTAETGGLTALIVKGSGTANLKVTLEWSR